MFPCLRRQVGNRHGIHLKNAMTHYLMFDAYRRWVNYLIHDVKEPNALHMRLGSKLQCVEMKASLRARGIFWTHVHHVWLIAIKDGERAANQKDACVFMVRLRKVMVDGMLDSTFLMNADFALFDDAVVMGIRNRWRTKGQNDRLHSNLFLADEETRGSGSEDESRANERLAGE